MQALEYPFDSSYILKNKRVIKRALLASSEKRIKKKIAVLGGSTTSEIINILELFLLSEGIEPSFYESEYSQYWQDAAFENKALEAFAPDIVYIHTTSRNLLKKNYSITESPAECARDVDAQFDYFAQIWERIAKVYNCPIIQNNFEPPHYRLLGNSDCVKLQGRACHIAALNMRFAEYARSHTGFYINDINWLASSFGLERWLEPFYWHMYKYGLAVPAIPELALNLSNIIKSIFGKNKKALALDLDNTLWGGIIGDDGADGIEIGHETPMGQVYSEFQDYIASHKDLGIMLTVCSKNDPENALAGLNHPEGILKPDDFVCIKANWDSKDRNLAATAEELNILPESMVFVDDNPAERAIASAQLHGIAAPELKMPEEYIRTIDRNGYFEVTAFSDDDAKRTEMYKANAARAAASKQFESYADYLASLEMTAVIRDFEPVYLSRITQLTNKSNQFNLTTRRYTEAQMQSVFESKDYIGLYGKLIDKFGDNGIVSVVIGKKSGNALDIELWLMSCRVLKRDMEYAMLDSLVAACRENNIEQIRGYYYPTAKNAMVKNLFADFGFVNTETLESGETHWLLSTDGYANKNTVISVNGNNNERNTEQ